MDFAMEHTWPGDFRDLSSSVMRLATLADDYRITLADVEDELLRLGCGTQVEATASNHVLRWVRFALTDEAADAADLFDLNALEGALEVVRDTHSMADAGRQLFAASRL